MIVVTGATGQLGRAVVDGLLARLPADRVVASVRDPEDGPVSWTARADLAEANAAVLAEEGRLMGSHLH